MVEKLALLNVFNFLAIFLHFFSFLFNLFGFCVFCLVFFGLSVFLGMGNLNSLLFVKHDHHDHAENDHDQKKRVCSKKTFFDGTLTMEENS